MIDVQDSFPRLLAIFFIQSMVRREEINSIVEEELKHTKSSFLQDEGKKLHQDWLRLEDPQLDFCRKRIIPRIKTYQGKTKRAALGALARIKGRIADTALRDMQQQEQHRRSADMMKQEILSAYELIERMGRGVVYMGSARTKPGHPDYEAGRELGREIALLLDVTSWSGAGPGAMEGPLMGAKEVGGKVAGIKIQLNGKESAFEQNISPVLREEDVVKCRYFGPRKIGLVDAGVAEHSDSRRAFIFLPGGFGTLDELFEMLTLKQLNKLGSMEDVPLLLMNYGGQYESLLRHIDDIKDNDKISARDKKLFVVCQTNEEALDCLADKYIIPFEERFYKRRLRPWHEFYPKHMPMLPFTRNAITASPRTD